jgi:threonine/homoserine/homoserine lactone efflux protein
MAFIIDFYVFLVSVMFISLSGVLMPGPLFAVTIEKAAKHKMAGALIALGHGIIEFPLMFLIFFMLSEFEVPIFIQIFVGFTGGLIMIYMGFQSFKNRNKSDEKYASSNQDSLLAGIRTTAFNPGFILWWFTIGTTLILNAKLFGLIGFSIFAGVHWSCDFIWYTIVAFLIFKSNKFWTPLVHKIITFFCVSILVGFGGAFFTSSLWQAISILLN